MSRKLLINIHLLLAAFLTPAIVIMALSGGLYLFGEKGTTTYKEVDFANGVTIDRDSESLKQDIDNLLNSNNISTRTEYIKKGKNNFITRPTNRTHYRLTQKDDGLLIEEGKPDIVASMMELHKGHGPSLFRWLEKILAIGLVFILLSGFYLGVTVKALKMKTLIVTTLGLAVFLFTSLF